MLKNMYKEATFCSGKAPPIFLIWLRLYIVSEYMQDKRLVTLYFISDERKI